MRVQKDETPGERFLFASLPFPSRADLPSSSPAVSPLPFFFSLEVSLVDHFVRGLSSNHFLRFFHKSNIISVPSTECRSLRNFVRPTELFTNQLSKEGIATLKR